MLRMNKETGINKEMGIFMEVHRDLVGCVFFETLSSINTWELVSKSGKVKKKGIRRITIDFKGIANNRKFVMSDG